MRDLVEPEALRHAVDMTMRRYPYFCVELKRDDEYYFAENDRTIVITHSLAGVDLNTPESNYHLASFSWEDNWIVMDISHAITDGTGAYEVMRFNIEHDGSPATMVTLFLCRAFSRLNPDSEDAIRVTVTVNQRNALGAPLAHQSLVGGAMLEYKEKLRSWPLRRQATIFRGMVLPRRWRTRCLPGLPARRESTR